MRVRDTETGSVLESDNELIAAQWAARPEKYTQLEDAAPEGQPEGQPEAKPTSKRSKKSEE